MVALVLVKLVLSVVNLATPSAPHRFSGSDRIVIRLRQSIVDILSVTLDQQVMCTKSLLLYGLSDHEQEEENLDILELCIQWLKAPQSQLPKQGAAPSSPSMRPITSTTNRVRIGRHKSRLPSLPPSTSLHPSLALDSPLPPSRRDAGICHLFVRRSAR